MKESAFQANLIRRIKSTFPGCIVLKNDANYIQGFPDLLILYRDKWAALECKASTSSPHQPNQFYYIQTLAEMSYAAFVYPVNEENVMDDLSRHFTSNLWDEIRHECMGVFVKEEEE